MQLLLDLPLRKDRGNDAHSFQAIGFRAQGMSGCGSLLVAVGLVETML